jgi:hypothetical protein
VPQQVLPPRLPHHEPVGTDRPQKACVAGSLPAERRRGHIAFDRCITLGCANPQRCQVIGGSPLTALARVCRVGDRVLGATLLRLSDVQTLLRLLVIGILVAPGSQHGQEGVLRCPESARVEQELGGPVPPLVLGAWGVWEVLERRRDPGSTMPNRSSLFIGIDRCSRVIESRGA